MIEISPDALTALVGYAVMFYAWMEAFIKPGMKEAAKRLRQRFAKEPLNEQLKQEQDELYAALLHSSFRIVSILMGIVFVWGNDIGVSFFDVFGHSSATSNQELLNWITTGAAIGLGSRGTHFLVDVAESVMRFSLVRLAPNAPGPVILG